MERLTFLLDRLDLLRAKQVEAVRDIKSFRDGTSYYIQACNDFDRWTLLIAETTTELRSVIGTKS